MIWQWGILHQNNVYAKKKTIITFAVYSSEIYIPHSLINWLVKDNRPFLPAAHSIPIHVIRLRFPAICVSNASGGTVF